jgi:ABC-type transporter Mla subunit MlaD
MNVGRVKQTTLEDRRVHVYVTLDVPITLRHGYKIDVVDASMLGGKYLKIYEGPEEAEPLGDNMTILGSKPIDMIEQLGSAVSGLQSMINAVSEGQGTLGKLLHDDAMYNNMAEASEDFKKIIARLENGEGTIGKLMKEDAIYEDASTLMANLRILSDRLEAGEGTLGKLMSEDTALYDDVSATMASMRNIAGSIDAGEGTIGKLVRDAKLYDEAASLVEDVRAAVDDLREASPITSFGSVIFGAF